MSRARWDDQFFADHPTYNRYHPLLNNSFLCLKKIAASQIITVRMTGVGENSKHLDYLSCQLTLRGTYDYHFVTS